MAFEYFKQNPLCVPFVVPVIIALTKLVMSILISSLPRSKCWVAIGIELLGTTPGVEKFVVFVALVQFDGPKTYSIFCGND